jgi:uncharacterized protein (TIGR03083 family)
LNPTRIDRLEAKHLALEEFTRFADVISDLSEEEWGHPTDCTRWDVHDLALHVLGSAEAQASFPEFVRQLRRGLPLNKEIESHHWVDGMNEWQIRQRRHLSNSAIAAQLAAIGPKAVKGRWGTPPPVRYLPIPFGPPVGWRPLKYLLDVGFTRDVWAHRIDLCAATNRPIQLTVDHDGRLVADVVAEWGALHAQPFRLTLGGPAGGTFSQGVDGEAVTLDAVEFVQILSGRRPGTGILSHPLPL